MKKTLVIGAALLGCVSVSPSVQAAAYAVSTNTISNFSLTSTGAMSFGGFTISSSMAALNVSGIGGAGSLDAPSSCIGATCSSLTNAFSAHGMGSADYSYGDALITSTAVTAGTGGASAIGEVSLSNGFASATGSNSMTGFLLVNTPGNVTFSFNANPYMWAELTAGGSSANAISSMSITITGSSGQVFSWAPVNLNQTIGRAVLSGVGSWTPGSLSFSTTTGPLTAGNYTVGVSMTNSANVTSVPLPAAAWLLISGVLGLAGFVRRRAM